MQRNGRTGGLGGSTREFIQNAPTGVPKILRLRMPREGGLRPGGVVVPSCGPELQGCAPEGPPGASSTRSSGSSGPSGPVSARFGPRRGGPTGLTAGPGPYCKRLHVFLWPSAPSRRSGAPSHSTTWPHAHTCADVCTEVPDGSWGARLPPRSRKRGTDPSSTSARPGSGPPDTHWTGPKHPGASARGLAEGHQTRPEPPLALVHRPGAQRGSEYRSGLFRKQ